MTSAAPTSRSETAPDAASSQPADAPTRLRYVLFPGRHHLLTRYQAVWLRRLLDGRVRDQTGTPVHLAAQDRPVLVWAVTSANHSNTRRNPVPAHRREAAIERLSLLENFTSVVVPVVDVAATSRFAALTVASAHSNAGLDLTPSNTVVACSTPAVTAQYEQLGFRVAGVELDEDVTPPRPWDVLTMLTEGDPTWRDLAHPATVDIYDRYALDAHIRMLAADPVVGDEGTLTETRAYGTYAASFEQASARKWAQVGPYVRPGRILDIGCATGGLLEQASRDPRLHESDLLGVEVSRHLFTEAEHKRAQGAFTANPNTFFYQANILAGDLFPPRSIDTTTTVALTHEIISYGDGLTDLRRLADAVFRHTVPGGVWVNSDVSGPDDPDRVVALELNMTDGHHVTRARDDLGSLAPAEAQAYLEPLSTWSRFHQFAREFRAHANVPFPFEVQRPGLVRLTLADAMEFITKASYVDSFVSECHERFTTVNWDGWVQLVQDAGFEVDPASHAWRNDWLVEHRFDPIATLRDAQTGEALPWPDTHVLMVARRPELG